MAQARRGFSQDAAADKLHTAKTSDSAAGPEAATSGGAKVDVALPSKSKFEGSAFGQLGKSSVSGFGALGGGSTSGSVFGGGSKSVFASSSTAAKPPPAAAAAAPTLSFGSASGPSPFGALNKPGGTNGFGSPFGGGGGGGSGVTLGSPWAVSGAGTKPPGLGSFASPGGGAAPLKSEKPAKPFGHPDSEGEEENDDDDNDDDDESGSSDDADKDAEKDEGRKEVVKAQSEEKKLRLQRGKQPQVHFIDFLFIRSAIGPRSLTSDAQWP
jgi:hypothetical protein